MLCDNCKKKEATVHLTQVAENKVNKLHLCDKCAEESGFDLDGSMSMSEILEGLGIKGSVSEQDSSRRPEPRGPCPRCGLTRTKLKEKGRLGCPQCYETFEDDMLPLIESIHNSCEHTGKTPDGEASDEDSVTDLTALRKQLEAAVTKEAYEEAAELRDRIRKIKHVASKSKG